MNKQSFRDRYDFFKKKLEEFDPASVGATGEYDDLIFSMIKKNKGIIDQKLFSDNILTVLILEFRLKEKDIKDIIKEITSQFFKQFPDGF